MTRFDRKIIERWFWIMQQSGSLAVTYISIFVGRGINDSSHAVSQLMLWKRLRPREFVWTSTDSRFRSANHRVFCSSRGLEEWKRAGCPSPKKNMNQQQQLSVSIFFPINENCSTRSAPVPFSYSSASVYSLTSVCKKKNYKWRWARYSSRRST